MKKTQQSILIVDDDKSVLNALHTCLTSVSDNISMFDSPFKCLKTITPGKHDLLITDINMPEMDGLTLMKQAKEIDPGLAVLVITGYAEIPLAVESLKMGAADFIEKPFSHEQITTITKKLLERQLVIGRDLFRKLTASELNILSYIVHGYGNRGIAHELNRSIRTVEDHRSNLMVKLKVDNVVDLLQTASELGLVKKQV